MCFGSGVFSSVQRSLWPQQPDWDSLLLCLDSFALVNGNCFGQWNRRAVLQEPRAPVAEDAEDEVAFSDDDQVGVGNTGQQPATMELSQNA